MPEFNTKINISDYQQNALHIFDSTGNYYFYYR